MDFPVPDERTARIHWLVWYQKELDYVDNKFDDQRNGHDTDMLEHGLDEDGFWRRQIFQYLDRINLFTLELPQGRQALAKMCMTAIGCLESAIRVHGPLPEPGHSSGNSYEWTEAPKISESEKELYSDRREAK